MTTRVDDAVIAGALEYWKGVDLTSLLRDLDKTGIAIVENQKTSLQERRKLADKTKEFRSVPDDQKTKEFKGLLRAYQNEIDSLTKRMKFAETGFLSLFKSLGEAPDPAPFISGLQAERKQSEQADTVQSELAAEQAKSKTLLEENRRLKEQARETAQLQKQVGAFEAKLDEMVKEQVGAREQELKDETDELIRHLKEREGDLQHQLSAANRQLAQLQATRDSEQADRAEEATAVDRELVVKLAEHDILQSDLDHANARIADLQAQNARLRAELTTLAGGAAGDGGETLEDYRRRVRELEEETERLFSSLEKAEAELHRQEARFASEQSSAGRDAVAKEDELKRLRAELKRCADYDEVKRDLEIMKSVEFSDWGMGEDAQDGESLERMLVKQNKALENKLTDARNQLSSAQQTLRETQTQNTVLAADLAEKRMLAEKLEADLLSVQPGSGPDRTSAEAPDAVELQPIGGDKDSGLLAIVTGQRDRFRQRNIELDEELRAQATSVGDLQRQVEQVKQDNLRLYEEIKYLRSYTSSQASSSHTVPFNNSDTAVISVPSKYSSRSVQIDMDTGVGAKYKGMYEESLNPFNAFQRRENSRRVRSMGVLDRLVYMVSNLIMGSWRARMALFAYITMLHLLVMITLYRSMLLVDSTAHEPVHVGDAENM